MNFMDNVWLDLDPAQNKIYMGALMRGKEKLAMLPLNLEPSRDDLKKIVAQYDDAGREAAEILAQSMCRKSICQQFKAFYGVRSILKPLIGQ